MRRTNGILSVTEGPIPVKVKETPEEGYHLMADMTDKAMNWIRTTESAHPR